MKQSLTGLMAGLFLSLSVSLAGSVALAISTVTSTVTTSTGQQLQVTNEVVPGEFIVKIRGQYGNRHMNKIFNRLQGRARVRRSLPGLNLHHVKITDGESAKDFIEELNQSDSVEYAEPNYVIHLMQSESGNGASAQSAPSGDFQIEGGGGSYTQSSANTKVTQSWAAETGTNNITVAVLDTGVDYNHYVFTGTTGIWTNPGEIANNGIDDDGNGYIDDVRGWNFVSGTNNPMDDNGHGTHCAGIVLGLGQNIFAGTLTTSYIKIMPLKFMDSSGTGTTAAAVSGIYYAIANGARVISNSWGGSGYAQSLNDALTYAYNHGLFIASAAGNYTSNDDSTPLYPASLPIPSQISVAATDNSDVIASFSSYGTGTVQLAAPGVNIQSTYPGNAFAYLSGTSMATPFVAGLAAQVLREAPQLTGYQVRQIIMQSVDVVSGLHNYVSTSGRVNALTTVQNSNSSITTQAYQPAYVEVIPPGVSGSSSGGSSGGCGTISTGAMSSTFWDRDGGSGGSGMGALSTVVALLMMPILAWMIVRSRLVTHPRRKYERFSMNTAVKVLRDGQEISGRLSTIGQGGVSFSVNEQSFEKGELITLQIAAPDHEDMIQVMGRIVWNRDDQSFGVQFGPMADHLVDKIEQWTTALLTVPSRAA